MDQKIRFRLNVYALLGLIFTLMGGMFSIAAAILGYAVPSQESKAVMISFFAVGIPFLLVGLGFLIWEARKRAQIRRLVAAGHYIWGTVSKIDWDTTVRINHRHPNVAVVSCQHDGQTHFFTSRHLPRHFPADLVGKPVKVYCQPPKCKPYYVDMEPLLSSTVVH